MSRVYHSPNSPQAQRRAARLARIEAMRAAGMSRPEMASALGMARGSLDTWLSMYSPDPPPPPRVAVPKPPVVTAFGFVRAARAAGGRSAAARSQGRS